MTATKNRTAKTVTIIHVVEVILIMPLVFFRAMFQGSMAAPLKDQAWNRRLYDGCKTSDDLRVTTGPGRYQLDAPPQYCNACFAPEPTVRQQRWGASLNSAYIKTDVESDLLNINRPTTKTVCGQYDPRTNAINSAAPVQTKECEFPQTHSRLVDPPCTLRSSGWNRWEWLCQNPQEGVMLPFDNLVTTRLAAKDSYRPCIPTPIGATALMPAPSAYNGSYAQFGSLDTGALSEINASMKRALESYPRGEDVLPAAPADMTGGASPAPVNPPSLAIRSGRGF